MGKKIFPLVATLLFALCGPADATMFTAEVTDQDGRPAGNAVVSLVADSRASVSTPFARLPAEKIIDQRNETFLPLVTVLPKGGRIIFANNDQTTHQVYSFSAVKQFEMTLARGEKSSPVVFDTSGVAALGCNIHDHMIAYAFVAESPWTAISANDGRAVISDVPAGNYEAQIWHPKLPPGRGIPSLKVAISGESNRLAVTIRLLSAPTMSRGHAGSY